MLRPALFAILTVAACLSTSLAYKDIVMIHGIFAGTEEFDFFTQLIQQQHPGQRIHNINLYTNMESVAPLWQQLDAYVEKLRPILTNSSSEGTILLSYSQGCVIARGVLATIEHNVHTWISLSGPIAGQFGDTAYMKYFFPMYLKDNLWRVLYTKEGQFISVSNYWNDPHQQDHYRKHCNYLPVLNNVSAEANPRSEEYRTNFLRLQQIVLIGGPDDEVITPWQSSHFGFYDENEKVQPMTSQSWYINDAFGLKTLDESGKVQVYTQPGIHHRHWHTEKLVFDKYILPWL